LVLFQKLPQKSTSGENLWQQDENDPGMTLDGSHRRIVFSNKGKTEWQCDIVVQQATNPTPDELDILSESANEAHEPGTAVYATDTERLLRVGRGICRNQGGQKSVIEASKKKIKERIPWNRILEQLPSFYKESSCK